MKITLKKTLFITCILTAVMSTAQAQNEVVISKDEFVASQLQMMEQVKQAQAEMANNEDDVLKDKMSAEEYEQYKTELDQAQKEQETKVADCLGISADKIPSLTEKMGADFQISVIESCSKVLPEQVNIGSPTMMESPEFAPYMACAEDMVAEEIGVSSEKLKSCSAMAQEL